MLNLSTFHAHKENVRKARLFEIDNKDLLVEKIKMLHDSFLRVAPYSKVKSSFEAAGTVYEPSEKMPVPTVRFSLEFATHI